MYIKIPFESKIEFKTNICEITKMSLEHEFNVNDGIVLGNFYISGEYRVHEVSVNREPFNYTLPFTVELRDDIKKDTIEFNIEDFSYDVIGKVLQVNIEYSLKAEVEETEEEVLFERVNEEDLESELAYIDSFLETTLEENDDKICDEAVVEEKKPEDTTITLIDEVKIEEKKETKEKEKEIKKENIQNNEDIPEERVTMEEEKTIMDTIKDSDDTFVTYRIHIVTESETIESICSMYSVSPSLVKEYNNIDNMNVGDKVLIPKLDE